MPRRDRQLVLAGSMTRFLNCDNLLDLLQAYGINKDALYASYDAINPPRWLRRLVRQGREGGWRSICAGHRTDDGESTPGQ
jgi:hypothetical protein